MYTQCPKCSSAFRVTAEVLRKAGGKVRCGGCHGAFNALEYLSESKPPGPRPPASRDEAVPELRPDAGSREQPGMSGDYEQLLADAGDEEIRFQDTGIEWRLLDDSVQEDDDDLIESEFFEGRGESQVDELLDDAPTPVDEFLTETPADIDAAEVFADDDMDVSLDAIEVFEVRDEGSDAVSVPAPPEEELRFDDNTGLPDDFDFDAPSTLSSTPPDPVPTAGPAIEPEHLPADLAFGDPDEWSELLQEVVASEPADVTTDGPAPHTPGPSRPVTIAEELDALSSAGEEFRSAAPPESSPDHGVRPQAPESPDLPFDLDTQFNLQALSLGIELSSSNDNDDDEPVSEQVAERSPADGLALTPSENDPTADETAISALRLQERDEQPAANEVLAGEATASAEAADDDALAGELAEAAATEADELADEEALAQPADDDDSPEIHLPADTGELQIEIEKARELVQQGDEQAADPEEHYVPPPTEEEQTVNMLIDEDLMRLAIPDEDGMASTIVFESKAEPADVDGAEVQDEAEGVPSWEESGNAGFETIIMEGAFARTEAEQKRLAAERKARERKKEQKARAAAEQAARDKAASARMRYGLIAGVVALAVLLVGQFVHQSRADLATVPAVSDAIEPVYRAVGAPITPDWDVKAWRLEVQGDSIGRPGGEDPDAAAAGDAGSDVLTIYASLANEAKRAMPYPLIGVSLTNRYEEVIGSRVFEPADYLSAAPGTPDTVAPGNSFEPAIVIDGISADATGYRLNVCYRAEAGKLRCAIEDFR